MPEKTTLRRARRDRAEGKAATTQAGEFVREEMEHAKRGKHPVKSRKQAIAIGLSKARRAGVKIPRKKGSTARGRSGGSRSTSRSSAAKSRSGASSRSRTSRRSR
ncbi:DUF6496 domain-containing protein [Anaeromyxobacter oryzae]|uniref:DUF6496 domain-containing protein n=1 Tax=Anaeromyxobacter oryzae TaxID=2918170 RepID=UPI0020BEE73D|nr:DUF6496 domain-containing protein [Anaeromyxobacter oryzae]